MHKFQDSRLLKYDAKIVRDVILDIEKYPEFLPWCSKATIISSNGLGTNEGEVVAVLDITFKGMSESYTSKVNFRTEKDNFFINVDAIKGPFRKLTNKWQIFSIKDGCKVDFFIDFEFKSKILDMVIGMVFNAATVKMINSFEKRVREVCE